jgi:hypothetical protein
MPHEPQDPVLEAAIEKALALVGGVASRRLIEDLRKSLRLTAAMDPRAQELLRRLRTRPVPMQSGARRTADAPAEDDAEGAGNK